MTRVRGRNTGAVAADQDAAGLGRWRAGLFVLPALVLIGVFLVLPALWTIYLGATDFQLTGTAAAQPRIVGMDNLLSVFSGGGFAGSLLLTLEYVVGSAVVGQAGLGLALAWVMRDRRGVLRRVVDAVVLLAWILPNSVVAFLWIALLDRDSGTLNALLGTPGFGWLLRYPMLSIIVFNIWRGTAFSQMLYSAALANVPRSQLETARLTGATPWRQLWDVVLPQIRGHVLTNLLLVSLWTFNDFTPFLLTAGGPDHRSETLPVFVYVTALTGGQLGLGAAISFVMLLVNLVIAFGYLRLLGRRKDGAA